MKNILVKIWNVIKRIWVFLLIPIILFIIKLFTGKENKKLKKEITALKEDISEKKEEIKEEKQSIEKKEEGLLKKSQEIQKEINQREENPEISEILTGLKK